MTMKMFHVAQSGLRLLLGLSLIAATALLFSAAPASAVTPSAGWSIGSVAEPTNFNAAETQDWVRELTVSATGGTYELEPDGAGFEGATGPIAWDASAEEVQKALEAAPGIGAGNVSVTGGPGDATGSNPYTVTWVGALSGGYPGSLALRENKLEGVGTVEEKGVQGGEAHDRYTLTAVNVGSRHSEGAVTIADKLPPGLVPVEMKVEEPASSELGTCSLAELKCTYSEPVPADHELLVTIYVALTSSSFKGPVINAATISGGGGREASTSESTLVTEGPASFGINQFAFEATGVDGAPDAQAGAHPYGVTTRIDLNTVFTGGSGPAGTQFYKVAQEVKDVAVELPLGFLGDPLATERCPETDLTDLVATHTACPRGTIVGTVTLVLAGIAGSTFPVYNIVPARGYPAELGFNASLGQPIFLYASVVPGESGYRLRVATPGALRSKLDVEDISLTIFGDPAEHNGGTGSAAFVTNPTRCLTESLSVGAEVSSWEGSSASAESTAYPDVAGCDLLQGAAAFDPSIEVQPETTQADAPSGYEVNLKLPQAPDVFGALATPELKNATVTLPAGVSVSPSAASGPNALEGCTGAQIDLLGTELGEGHPGGDGSPYDDGLTHASPGHCPEGSRIGEVEVKTPLLEESLHGHVYLAEPHCGQVGQAPCTEAEAEAGKVFGLYMEMAGSGVIVKLVGSVEAGGYGAHSLDTGLAPGQLRARFDENPQLPFEDLKMTFTGGQRAPLENPQTCGTFTTTSDLEPWSAPESGPNATPSWPFAVTGCGGGFAPAFSAGTVTPLAGAYSPFTLTFSRQDGEQNLSGLTVTMPPGLLGALKGVEQCPEPQASQGACGSGSLIGHDQVAAGAGTEPLWETGRVYLTGPYRGAPFGLSIVTPAVAGPFNLGNVVVRATIAINPNTAQITTTSDPFPQLVDGVPLRIKTVNVTIDRSGFMFNPTNCAAQAIAGTISSAQGASESVSSPFAVAGCANLPFKPGFTASTQGKTSKADGASLVVKVAQKPGEANIHKVDLTLPNVLPSRLTTLQKACTEAQFNANPAGCPPGSFIGTAIAHTPVLNAPLTGPAILVSHGGAAFPDVEFLLQGEGVEILLDGKTDIKGGITYSRFETVPDAPITSFETTLPEGPHSVLAAYLPANANGSFCGLSLAMPTTIEGQNGAQIKQSTTIAVTGCKAAIKVVKKKRSGGQVLLTLRSTVAGTLTVTGGGIKKTTEKLAVGEHQIKVALTNAGRHRKKIKLKVDLRSGKSTLSKLVAL